MKIHLTSAQWCAVIGTILIWLPVIFMLITGIIGSLRANQFLMDYLLPAELFFVEVIGCILLIIASLLANIMKKIIIIMSIVIVVVLPACQLIAVVSGMASGAMTPDGLIWYLVLGLLFIYDILIVVIGILGIRLIYMIHAAQGEIRNYPAEEKSP
jgi:hypothetical protein